ncbi:GFA family protein [Agaribacterium sp. ZY112]|uniref:GFA family protein n=1 Tax=Agaribacterium sp. ZY112 TaxID=3233574 RepID=UPI0035263DD1
MLYQGGCHCGAVRFEIEAPDCVEVEDCNCSICKKTGFLHLILPKTKFKLLQGEQDLSLYGFNSGVAKHYFCKHCGVKSFYIPRSNPDGVDVNLRCLDQAPEMVSIQRFDGENWEANAASLAHKSKLS